MDRDVSVDPAAAREMIRRSGQSAVPVITAGDEVIVGFDRPRLERIAARYAQAGAARPPTPRLGLIARNAPGGGVELGGTRPGSPGERAGLKVGDVLEAFGGEPVRSMADLERIASGLQAGRRVDLGIRRDGQHRRLTLVA